MAKSLVYGKVININLYILNRYVVYLKLSNIKAELRTKDTLQIEIERITDSQLLSVVHTVCIVIPRMLLSAIIIVMLQLVNIVA